MHTELWPACSRVGIRRRTLAVLVAGAVGLTGCDRADCALSASPGLRVDVVDSVTGEPQALGASAIVYQGETVIDSLWDHGSTNPALRSLWSQRVGPGTYRVRVARAGYEGWERSTVLVEAIRSECGTGTRTTVLEARLVPSSAP